MLLRLNKRCAMNEISRTIFRLSFSVVAFSVRGNQDSVVQQQIETIGLRQWLFLVATWILEAIYSETAQFRGFVMPSPQFLRLTPAMAKMAVPAPIYLF
jgi:hypothetical protein